MFSSVATDFGSWTTLLFALFCELQMVLTFLFIVQILKIKLVLYLKV